MFTNEASVPKAVEHLSNLLPDFETLTAIEFLESLDKLGHLVDIEESYSNPLRPFVEQLAETDKTQYSQEEVRKHRYKPGMNLKGKIDTDVNWYLYVYRSNSNVSDVGYTIAKKLQNNTATAGELIIFLGEIHAIEAWMKAVFFKSFLASIR